MADQKTEDGAPQQASAPPAEGPTSVLIAVGLLVVSLAFAIGGLRVPQPEGWHTAPGMLPVVLGFSLFAMALVLLIKALRAGALRVSLAAEGGDSSLARVARALLIIGVFYFGLLAFLPFEVAAALFLLAMLWQYWPQGPLWGKLAIAAGIPVLVTLSFQGMFSIPLPGQGNLVLLAQYIWVTW